MQTPETEVSVRLDLDQPIRWVVVAFAALIVIFGLWAGLTRINGAVIASGSAVVEGRNFPIQTLAGGIVDEVYVKEGDFVTEGSRLLRLDPKLLSIQLESARNRLGAVMATLQRLSAERRGDETLTFAYPSLPIDQPNTQEFEEIERQIFDVRRDIQLGREEALVEVVAQLESQKVGSEGQVTAIVAQIETLAASIIDMQSLVDQRLMRRRELESEMGRQSDLLGQLAVLRAEQNRLNEAVREARIQATQAGRTFQEEVGRETAALSDEMQQLILDIATREEELSRVNIIAPADGIVQQLAVTSNGGVVAPNQTILEIIPVTANLEFSVRVPPVSIDEVSVGQQAEVVIAAFDVNATPRLYGTVAQVSATTITDDRTGENYYEAIVSLSEDQVSVLGDNVIVPGMPADVFLQTGARSVLSFLLEPIADPLNRAFRE